MFSGFTVAQADAKQENDTPKLLCFGLQSRKLYKSQSFGDSPATRVDALTRSNSPIMVPQQQPCQQRRSNLGESDSVQRRDQQRNAASRIAETFCIAMNQADELCSTVKCWLGFAESDTTYADLNLARSYALLVEKQVPWQLGMQAALTAVDCTAQQKEDVTRLICNPDVLQLPDSSLVLLQSCPNIRFLMLTLQGSEVLQLQPAPACWKQLPRLLQQLPALSCIDISNCACTDAELQAISSCCPGLMGIDLSFNPGITDEGLQELVQGLQLQEIDISNCCSLGPGALHAVACCCKGLNTLYLEQREVGQGSSDEYAVRCATSAGLRAVAHGCPALKVLSLAGMPLCPDQGSDSSSSSSSSSSSLGSRVGQHGCLAAITEHCSSLCSLDLSGCGAWLTEQQLLEATKHARALTSLTLTGGDSLTDAVACSTGLHCTGLQRLALLQCPRLTDAGAAALLRGCTALQELQASGCPQLTDATVRALACCRQLRQLDLDLSSSLGASLEAVQRVAEGLPLASAHVALPTGTFQVVDGKGSVSSAWNALMGFLNSHSTVGGFVSPAVHRAGGRL